MVTEHTQAIEIAIWKLCSAHKSFIENKSTENFDEFCKARNELYDAIGGMGDYKLDL